MKRRYLLIPDEDPQEGSGFALAADRFGHRCHEFAWLVIWSSGALLALLSAIVAPILAAECMWSAVISMHSVIQHVQADRQVTLNDLTPALPGGVITLTAATVSIWRALRNRRYTRLDRSSAAVFELAASGSEDPVHPQVPDTTQRSRDGDYAPEPDSPPELFLSDHSSQSASLVEHRNPRRSTGA